MFKWVLALFISASLLLSGQAFAKDVHVSGYTRRDGTYVPPYTRTSPNRTTRDNYSTVGNVNPYTGQPGTKPDAKPAGTVVAPVAAPTYEYVSPAMGGSGLKASVTCRDGTTSYSQHRSGTCSNHGGVAAWR